MDPAALKYAKTHEWVHVEGDVATIGISYFAVKELTDLVYIDLPEIGTLINAGETFGEVESVKAVSDLYLPISGKVIEVNSSLADNLGILSEDPFGQGWMVKLRISEPATLDSLLDRPTYDAHCAFAEH